jgi:hypothetical protein
MLKVVEQFSEQAKEIISEHDKDDLSLILNKQYDLMIHIFDSKKLYAYGVDNLVKNMMLSIFDELNEYIDVIFAYELEYEERKTEALFELVDAFHFIFQLHFLATIKQKGYRLSNLSETNVRNEILTRALNHFSSLSFAETIEEMPDPTEEILTELYSKMMLKTSEVLDKTHWKHWKTYKEFDYYSLTTRIITLFNTLLYNFKLLDQSEDFHKKITEYYVIKNIENFDRQDRGY